MNKIIDNAFNRIIYVITIVNKYQLDYIIYNTFRYILYCKLFTLVTVDIKFKMNEWQNDGKFYHSACNLYGT